jgi:outer membrane protein OmpA-like peptidoglycan-associated protein
MRIFLLSFLTLVSLDCLHSQTLSTKNKKAIDRYVEADNYRVRGQYEEAIKMLQQAIEKDKKFEEAYYQLGAVYRSAGDLEQSCLSMEKGLALVSAYPFKQKTYFYVLGENYLRRGKYTEAQSNLDKFLAIEKTDRAKMEKALLYKTQIDYAFKHQQDKANYQIKALSDTVNAFPMQYFPAITADGTELIFTVRYGRAHEFNEDIFTSKKVNGKWQAPVSLSGNLNSNFREGACSISADGRQLILTICGQRGCDLYESKKEGDVWGKPEILSGAVNSNGWEAQPSLSADGNELYFVSDRKGGLGGYDIWYSRKDETGAWTRAVNMGKPVNTKYDEIAPYIHVNNQNLYYASNGMPGFGGFDIYVSEKANQQWTDPVNLGAPLNDYEDQYSFVVSSDGKVAYYSREESRTKSKLYTTSIPESIQVKRRGNVVRGTVSDSKTKLPLRAHVELFDLQTNTRISAFQSDSVNGSYLVVVPGLSQYALHVTEPGYLFHSLHFNYEEKDLEQPLVINLELQPISKNATAVLNNIFFDYNKAELTEKSFSELNEIVKFLKENPTVKVEISGHTDNVGNEAYNKQLSLKRAQSVVDYLVAHGVETSRLSQKGYGSQKPIKPNDTEANKQANRRIEFTIE